MPQLKSGSTASLKTKDGWIPYSFTQRDVLRAIQKIEKGGQRITRTSRFVKVGKYEIGVRQLTEVMTGLKHTGRAGSDFFVSPARNLWCELGFTVVTNRGTCNPATSQKATRLRAKSEKILRRKHTVLRQAVGRRPNVLEELKQDKNTYSSLSPTVRQAIVESRLGQGRFRTYLINYWKRCAVTSCQVLEVLKASHIKPWRQSTNDERMDPFNGLLLTPNLDAAFDSGFITFRDDGMILISAELDTKSMAELGIHQGSRLRRITPRHVRYLQFHRKNVFKR